MKCRSENAIKNRYLSLLGLHLISREKEKVPSQILKKKIQDKIKSIKEEIAERGESANFNRNHSENLIEAKEEENDIEPSFAKNNRPHRSNLLSFPDQFIKKPSLLFLEEEEEEEKDDQNLKNKEDQNFQKEHEFHKYFHFFNELEGEGKKHKPKSFDEEYHHPNFIPNPFFFPDPFEFNFNFENSQMNQINFFPIQMKLPKNQNMFQRSNEMEINNFKVKQNNGLNNYFENTNSKKNLNNSNRSISSNNIEENLLMGVLQNLKSESGSGISD